MTAVGSTATRTACSVGLLLFGGLLSACGDGTGSAAGPGSGVVPSMGGQANTSAGQANTAAGQATEPTGGGSGGGGNASNGGAGSGGASAGDGNNGGSVSGGSASGGTSGGASAGAGAGSGGSGGLPLWEVKQAAFLKVIGRPKVPLDVKETPKGQADGLTVEDFSFQSDAKTRIYGTSYRPPAAGKYPAVIYLHGTGGTRTRDIDSNRSLAKLGFFVLAIDARYHGQTGSGYEDAIYKGYVSGDEHPFLYDTVWDVMRLVDYLEGRADVDSQRVGLYGRSKGGMETYLATAVEPRIKAAVPWIGVQNWAWALDNNQWQARVGSIQGAVDQAAKHDGVSKIDANYVRKFYDGAVPGMYKEFDAIQMLPAIAPRPLLAINGDSDARCPLVGLRLVETATNAAYAAAGAPDHFKLLVQTGIGHDVTPSSMTATNDWFVKYLKP